MSNPVISVDRLGKSYRLGLRAEKHATLGEAVMDVIKAPWQRFRSLGEHGDERDTFWALRDVSFDVQCGEVVGIIGRNGAGKSTLLKCLSRITEPTEGRAVLRGRVASLLEVGTGFHPELTGRENIYLNGSILGMKKTEIARKFDEIVDFSGVEKFLDTPVKRYSSGMSVRLAFAVAAHLEPEILIVDEVLAVGDADFQRKCMGKMREVAQGEGRTILFVSHNMGALQALCSRGVLLRDGRVVFDGATIEAVEHYLGGMEGKASESLADRIDRAGTGASRLLRVEAFRDGDPKLTTLMSGRPATFRFHVSALLPNLTCKFTFYDPQGAAVASLDSSLHSRQDRSEEAVHPSVRCEMDQLLLLPGRYRVNAALHRGEECHDHVESAFMVDVEQGQINSRPIDSGSLYGRVHLPHRWVLAGRA